MGGKFTASGPHFVACDTTHDSGLGCVVAAHVGFNCWATGAGVLLGAELERDVKGIALGNARSADGALLALQITPLMRRINRFSASAAFLPSYSTSLTSIGNISKIQQAERQPSLQ